MENVMNRVRRKDKISNTDRSSGRRVGLGVREVEVLYHVVNRENNSISRRSEKILHIAFN